MVKEEHVELEKYCHYSDLPSPMAYVNTIIDYDGMGNQGRFPESRKKEKSFMKKLIQKILCTSFVFLVFSTKYILLVDIHYNNHLGDPYTFFLYYHVQILIYYL